MEHLKTTLLSLIIILTASTATMAQEREDRSGKRHFSPEEFQAKQQAYLTEEAELTQQEADAFFPIYFELKKKKFELERNVHRNADIRNRENMTEEQCREFVNKMSDVMIETAKLEKEYTEKYLQIIPACKLLRIRKAEMSFQRYLMKKMTQRGVHGQNLNRQHR